MSKLTNKIKKNKWLVLIAAIALVVIIGAIAVPKVNGAKQQAQVDTDDAILREIARAAESYAAENEVTPVEGKDHAYINVSVLIEAGLVDGEKTFQLDGKRVGDDSVVIIYDTATKEALAMRAK